MSSAPPVLESTRPAAARRGPEITVETDASASVSDLIVAEFERRAAEVGIRNIVMADLAQSLGISTKTLYKHFHTKDELLNALLDRWQVLVTADQQFRWTTVHDPVERMVGGALALYEARRRFCDAFWTDLFQHYPEAAERLQETISTARDRAGEWYRSMLRPDVSPALLHSAQEALFLSAMSLAASPPEGMSPTEVVAQVFRIWARGIFKPEVIA